MKKVGLLEKVEPDGESGILGFLKILEDMEKKGEPERQVSGEISGPFFSRALFGCKIRLGLGRLGEGRPGKGLGRKGLGRGKR